MEIATKISPEEYLRREARSDQKHEYNNGEIRAMAGAQLPHNQIVSNLIFLLNRCLWESHCQVLPSDMLLKLPEACNRFTYPDLMLVCGTPKLDKRAGIDVLLNPTVVIEVLSETSRSDDTDSKKDCYLALASLRQYVLVDSQSVHLSSYTRQNSHDWTFRQWHQGSEKVRIHECEISIAEVYRNVEEV